MLVWLRIYAAIAVAFLLARLGWRRADRRADRAEDENRRLQDAQAADRRIDNADTGRGDAADDLRWLRDRANRRR